MWYLGTVLTPAGAACLPSSIAQKLHTNIHIYAQQSQTDQTVTEP